MLSPHTTRRLARRRFAVARQAAALAVAAASTAALLACASSQPPADAAGVSTSGLVAQSDIPDELVVLDLEGERLRNDQASRDLGDRSAARRAADAGVEQSLVEALDRAYADEAAAIRLYSDYIDAFGDRPPFSNIVHAEVRHADAVLGLYATLGLTPPTIPQRDSDIPADRAEACRLAADSERDNVAMYDELLRLDAVRDRPAVVRAFEHLRWASLERHLPAFERCAQGGMGRGHGPNARADEQRPRHRHNRRGHR